MATPTLDENKPLWGSGNQVAENLTQIRNNTTWIISQLAAQQFFVIGWNLVVNGADKSKPDNVVLTHAATSRKVRATYTYTGDDLTQMVIAFDDGGGFVNFTGGTLTITYDGNGDVTGATWA